MNAPVYGAGVIGCYLAHALCKAGSEATLLARDAWKDALEADGLVIRHRLQRNATADHPAITDAPALNVRYNAIFAVMQCQQLWAVLDDLAAMDTPLAVLVGNNASASEMERRIPAKTTAPKTVLWGFQGTARRREGGGAEAKVLCKAGCRNDGENRNDNP